MIQGRTRGIFVGLMLTIAGCSGDSETPPVYIGHLAPLTGADATAGRQARQGVELALEDGKAKDEKLLGHSFAALHIDTKSEPDLSQAEVVRVLTVNKVAAILGTVHGSQSEALLKGVRGYGAPIVVTQGAGDVSLGQTALRVFAATPKDRANALTQYLSDKVGAKKVAFIRPKESTANEPVADLLRQQLRTSTGTVIETYTEYELDHLKTLAHADIPLDALVVSVPFDELAPILSKTRSLEPKVPVIYAGPDIALYRLPTPPKEAELIVATAFFAESENDSVKQFVTRYRDRFDAVPDLDAVLSYDGMRFLLETLSKAHGMLGEQIREPFLAAETFETITGPAKIEGHQLRRKVFVVKRTATETFEVKVYDPE